MLSNLGDTVLDHERMNTIELGKSLSRLQPQAWGRGAHGGIIRDARDDLWPQRTILVRTCIHEFSEGICSQETSHAVTFLFNVSISDGQNS